MGEAKRRMQAGEYPGTPKPSVPGQWVLSDPTAQKELERWFTQRGIQYAIPGLHDSEEFLTAEQEDPAAINALARFVEARTYSADELADAERKICIVAEAVRLRLERDGRPGLCVPASCVLSRMLDELAVWNYTAKANVAIHWPTAAMRVAATYFYSVDIRQDGTDGPVAPHAIVVAPPFTVIDVTIRHQAYQHEALAQLLPAMALTKDFIPYRPTLEELTSPERRAWLEGRGQSLKSHFQRPQCRGMLALMRHLPPREMSFGEGRLSYAPVGVAGYSHQLREIGSDVVFDGLTAAEIFDRDVLPKL